MDANGDLIQLEKDFFQAGDMTRKVTLTIADVKGEDSGAYRCHGQNSIGGSAVGTIQLLVKDVPRCIKHGLQKAASFLHDTAKLKCKCYSHNQPSFTWSYKGVDIISDSMKYQTTYNVQSTSDFTYESLLTITNVTNNDYGNYTCYSTNDFGTDKTAVVLQIPGAPDPPLSFKVINSTHDSIFVKWLPGFDGGHRQKFQIKLEQISMVKVNSQKILDVAQKGENFTVNSLPESSQYRLYVRAMNKEGASQFVGPIYAETKQSEVKENTYESVINLKEMPLVILLSICAVGFLFVLLNLIILIACVKRKCKIKKDDMTNENKSVPTLSFHQIVEKENTENTFKSSIPQINDRRLSYLSSNSTQAQRTEDMEEEERYREQLRIRQMNLSPSSSMIRDLNLQHYTNDSLLRPQSSSFYAPLYYNNSNYCGHNYSTSLNIRTDLPFELQGHLV